MLEFLALPLPLLLSSFSSLLAFRWIDSSRRNRWVPRALFVLVLAVVVFGDARRTFVAAAAVRDIVRVASSASPSNDTSSTPTITTSGDAGGVDSSSSSTPSPMPSAFDNTPLNAFEGDDSDEACPKFMSSLLSNSTFQSCYALSTMLQTSTSFFQAEKSLVGITRVLDSACHVNSSLCTAFMDAAASDLTSSRACKKEYDQNQTLVYQAYQGLRAYAVLYSATCLRSPDTDQYCFAEAVTDADAPSNNYLYFLPFGLPLPNDSAPLCDWCTQQTMAVYHAAAANRHQLISRTYQPAAKQLDSLCGSKFVSTSLPPASSLATIASPVHLILLTLLWTAYALS